MAARSSTDRHTVTFNLENNPPDQQQTNNKDKRTSLKPGAATRVEKLCKLFAVFLVVVAFIFHLIRIISNGSDTCNLMFGSGWWRNDMWQPYGCMMHQYIPSEVRTCLQNQPIAFIGDSRNRGLYNGLVTILNPSYIAEGKKHSDMKYEEGNITISYFWQPEVNKSVEKLFENWIKSPKKRPKLIITGMSVWTIRDQGIEQAMMYKRNLSRLKESIEVLSNINYKPRSKLQVPTLKPPFPESPVVIWMKQKPVVSALLKGTRKTITDKKIDFFNKIADDVFDNSSVQILHAAAQVSEGHPEATTDGIHYGHPITSVELDFIMNFYCNNYMQVTDASCCVEAPRITRLQYNAIAVFVTCIVLFLMMFICRWLYPSEHDGPAGVEATTPGGHASSSLRWVYSDHMYPVMKNVAILGVIMFYFYLCDRTNLFFKEQKQYSNLVFGICMLMFLALGAYTWTPVESAVLINRDQTDEWRGWMQLIILLYHYTGASKQLPIYVLVRLLVASYLFMSGYGHFTFFWKKGDYSLYRFCQVMTRMNLFTAVVCLVMGRPYQFYYFAPLVSFWFVVVYLTMAVLPRVTAASVRDDPKQYVFVWLKFFVLFGVIYIIWSSPVLCDWLFSQWAIKELFIDVNDSVREWRFRSWLDRYIVLYGMVFAFAYCTAKQLNVFDDTTRKRLFSLTHTNVTLFMSALALVVYGIQAFTCSTKHSCNATHSVASCVPITAYLLLRNLPTFLRVKFSRLFAWIGRMALELFIAQYHIWLAQDTKGILVLIPGQPLLNVIVTTFIFVCICHEVHKVSGELTNAMISKDITTMLRRLVIFIITLIIIWWHKTHHTMRPRLD